MDAAQVSRRVEDIRGSQYGSLTAIRLSRIFRNKTFWVFRCVCGNEKEINRSSVVEGDTTSCGCRRRSEFAKSIIGKTFGNITVIECLNIKNKRGHWLWKCRCKCGEYVQRSSASIKRGNGCGCSRSLEEGLRGFNELYQHYQTCAKDRGHGFELNKEQFYNLNKLPCSYCGAEPKQNLYGYVYNGIDRIDNSKGYILDNCTPCCKHCNRMKSSMLVADFLNHIRRISEFQAHVRG